MQAKQKRKNIFIAVAGITILILVILLFPRKNSIDQLPDEPTSNNYSSQAIITGGEELMKQMESLKAHEFMASDLFNFAKKNYPAYQNKGSSVGFKLESTPQKSEKIIRFKGRYGALKNTITVEVTLLKKERIKISITDTKTKQNIDGELSSNSVRNQFIGTLPLEKDGYSIDYQTNSDTFLITSYDGSANTKSLAENYLMNSLKESSLKNIRYTYLVTRSSGTRTFPDLD